MCRISIYLALYSGVSPSNRGYMVHCLSTLHQDGGWGLVVCVIEGNQWAHPLFRLVEKWCCPNYMLVLSWCLCKYMLMAWFQPSLGEESLLAGQLATLWHHDEVLSVTNECIFFLLLRTRPYHYEIKLIPDMVGLTVSGCLYMYVFV